VVTQRWGQPWWDCSFSRKWQAGVYWGWDSAFFRYRMLRSIDNYQVEVLLTLALVTGGYALVEALHCSAPHCHGGGWSVDWQSGRSFPCQQ